MTEETKDGNGIVWEEPPTESKYRSRYAYFWNALRENPGKWGVYPGRGCGGKSRYPGFEFRHVDRGRIVYARYIGPNGEFRS